MGGVRFSKSIPWKYSWGWCSSTLEYGGWPEEVIPDLHVIYIFLLSVPIETVLIFRSYHLLRFNICFLYSILPFSSMTPHNKITMVSAQQAERVLWHQRERRSLQETKLPCMLPFRLSPGPPSRGVWYQYDAGFWPISRSRKSSKTWSLGGKRLEFPSILIVYGVMAKSTGNEDCPRKSKWCQGLGRVDWEESRVGRKLSRC